jgi:cell division protein FtsB
MSKGLFQSKRDVLGERQRSLEGEIAALEAEIQRLNALGAAARPPSADSVVFESVRPEALAATRAPGPEEVHLNDLGGRKVNIPALWRSLKRRALGEPASDPRLISYLAAGNIHGLRPLRHERRVARNRFILWSLALFLFLWGLLTVILRGS